MVAYKTYCLTHFQASQRARRQNANPARNDRALGQAIENPGPPVPNRGRLRDAMNANVADARRLEDVRDAAANFRDVIGSAHPGAINPNEIQIFSGSRGSTANKRRMLQYARGEEIPSAQRPEVQGFMPSFSAQMQLHSTRQEMQAEAAIVTAASGFLHLL